MQNKSRRQFLFSGLFAVLAAPFVKLPKQPNLVRHNGWFKSTFYTGWDIGRSEHIVVSTEFLERDRKILALMKRLNHQLASGEFDRPIGADEAIKFINKLKEIA